MEWDTEGVLFIVYEEMWGVLGWDQCGCLRSGSYDFPEFFELPRTFLVARCASYFLPFNLSYAHFAG